MMKMRKIVLFVLCIGWLFFPDTLNSGILTGHDSNAINESDPISLKGKLDPGPGLRSGGNIITAELQGNVVIASFHSDLGNILVSLSNDMGVPVFEGTVNTTLQTQIFISLSGLPSGIYTITFSNGLGAMYGDFEI